MEHLTPIIEVIRKNKALSSIKIIMPVWHELGEDEKVYIKMPLLGGLITYAMDENDAIEAVKEAIHCFSVACDKFGNGLENELTAIGWSISSKNEGHVILNVKSPKNDMFNLVLETGETTALDIELVA